MPSNAASNEVPLGSVPGKNPGIQTRVWAPFGLTACLRYAESIFESQKWRTSAGQVAFMERIFGPAKGVIDTIPEEMLRCIAASSAEEINTFLREHGSGKIQLNPFQDSNSVGFAAVTRVLVNWAVPGTQSTIRREGKEFPGAKLKRGVTFHRAANIPIIAKLHCKESGTFAYMTPVQPVFESGTRELVSMIELCKELEEGASPISEEIDGVSFPMIDLEQSVDLNWILGMELDSPTRPQPMFVRQALQLLGFKMNHLGAAFRDEVAIEMAMRGGFRASSFVIDSPFLFWISREGLGGMPLFAGVLAEDVWKNPGDLVL